MQLGAGFFAGAFGGRAGICSCGKRDRDSDGDGKMDCLETCAHDPNKDEAGTCGCGLAETDTDGDGTPDCYDLCDEDPLKTKELGVCGCGKTDVDQDGDGKIESDEWVYLVEYVTAAHAITVRNSRTEPVSRVTDEMCELLPEKLLEYLTSEVFIERCMASFDKTDKDSSNALEPNELWSE